MKSRLLDWWKTRKPNVLEMIDKCRTIGFAIFVFGLVWLYFTKVEYMWYQKEHYINQTEEREIVDRMIDKVSERISDTIYTKLELYYNSASVPDIVANKIYMAVMAYVIENNKTKTSVKSKTPDVMQSI